MHAGTSGTGGPGGEQCGRLDSSEVPESVRESKKSDIGGKPCMHLPQSRIITGTTIANSLSMSVSHLDFCLIIQCNFAKMAYKDH